MTVIRIGLMAVGLVALLFVGLTYLLNRQVAIITDAVPDKAQELDLADLESFLAYTIYNMDGQALEGRLRMRGIEPEAGERVRSGYVVSVPELSVAGVSVYGFRCHLANDDSLSHAEFTIDRSSEPRVLETLKRITSSSYYNRGFGDVQVHHFWSEDMQVTSVSKGPKVYFSVSRR